MTDRIEQQLSIAARRAEEAIKAIAHGSTHGARREIMLAKDALDNARTYLEAFERRSADEKLLRSQL